ncbi:protein NDH-DEPENDENT CYCLIC ELECTRON FLOW 5 [Cinnamomum micranthum f. kanehirae]|uniref:Protein NDH-DEPENDENT CYCLIC ELECTRON FLOW 5 n=1 Tax=Cinnamomum micranthum f. kanehirae TaxID=337451 RepID=A0A3S3Q6R7_9MAGN|nr:protein NDH-DEPENDENT CYCLIC ELECTRON FLOW 5 [Cinnamomum micranthum f. kanehirae]
MAKSFLFSPTFTPITSTNPSKYLHTPHTSLMFFDSHHPKPKRDCSLLALASSSHSPINVDYLESEFGGHGVGFTEIGDSCVVKMGLEDGSTANLMLPSGLITSYKPHMWHGGMMEVLHTAVSEGQDGVPVVQGGVSMDFKCGSSGGITWSPSTWALHDVRGSPQDSIQVELISSDIEAMVEFKYIVTLRQDLLSSEVMITNLKSSNLHLMGSVVTHLTVSTPDATYAIGLQGSNYFSKPPLMSDFSIIPPDFGQKRLPGSRQPWATTLQGLLLSWDNQVDKDSRGKIGEQDNEGESEGEEDDNYAHLTDKMSRIYTSTPRRFTVIDRGRRNSVIVGKAGFDELYIFSPGSTYKWYGKYSYICTGPSAMLKPVILGPEGVWRGAQYLHNPNN